MFSTWEGAKKKKKKALFSFGFSETLNKPIEFLTADLQVFGERQESVSGAKPGECGFSKS